jgi:hypothetical protein
MIPTGIANIQSKMLVFADDMLLISTTVAGLSAQLQSLQTYCDDKKLTVNTAKTQVTIMRPGGGSGGRVAASLLLRGQAVGGVESHKVPWPHLLSAKYSPWLCMLQG